ncbi:MAG: hypothetical protein Q7S27_04350 [Nanoarchaeota archaeon]|nr:hypothetical protein [Nanoarchaeota archaeon]
MDRRGFEFAWGVLFSIIMVIMALAVLLLAYGKFNFKGFTIDETCKFSVLTLATTPDVVKNNLNIPLKCNTRKLCISNRFFGKCEGQFSGESAELVRLGGSSTESARTIDKTIADSMLACWKMMGEGKLDLWGNRQGLSADEAKAQCVICSRIALDKEFIEDKENFDSIISQVNVNQYLENHKAPQSEESYLSLFTDNAVRSYGSFREEFSKKENEGRNTNELAIIFAQVNTKEDPLDVAANAALKGTGFILAGNAALSPLGIITNIIKKPLLFIEISSIAVGSGFSYLKAQNDQTVSAAYCGGFSNNDENRKGCSVISAVDYNQLDKINEMCAGGILGNA